MSKKMMSGSASAATAAVFAGLLPLSALVSPALATTSVGISLATPSWDSSTSAYKYEYTVTNFGDLIQEIVIPEFSVGAFLNDGSGNVLFKGAPADHGWNAGETTSNPLSGVLADGAPAYVGLFGFELDPNSLIGSVNSPSYGSGSGQVGLGTTVTFDLYSNFNITKEVPFGYQTGDGSVLTVDPPSPVAGVPEPGTFALLGSGLLGLFGLRRYRKA